MIFFDRINRIDRIVFWWEELILAELKFEARRCEIMV